MSTKKATTKKRGRKSKLTPQQISSRLRMAADLFRKNVDPQTGRTISVPRVNAVLKEKFGYMLNSQQARGIRDQLLVGVRK